MQDRLKELFTYRNGCLYWAKKSSKYSRITISHLAGSLQSDLYISVSFDNKRFKLHQLIYCYFHGFIPDFIDHIDGNKLNNTIANLRPCTNSLNQANTLKRKKNTSGFKGVFKSGSKYRARVEFQGSKVNLGTFSTKEEAAKAYNQAAIHYFGEFAKLNEVEECK